MLLKQGYGVLSAGLVGLFAVSVFAGEEKPVPMDKVPAHVILAAENAAPGVKFKKAAIEVEEQVTYELAGKNAEGRQIEVDVTVAGKVLEVETEVKMDEVPEKVSAALKRRMPNFEAKFIEKSKRPCSVWYEFEGKDAGSANTDVEISECGKKIIVEEDDDVDVRVK